MSDGFQVTLVTRAGRTDRASYLLADSDSPTAACPAASRAVSTRKGEQLT